MIFHFKDKFPMLNKYWDKYLPYHERLNVPAKTKLLEEGKLARNYIFIEKGCVRLWFNNNGEDKTVQFFFEGEGLTSFESFTKKIPSLFTIETIEPSVVYLLPRVYVDQLLEELKHEPEFLNFIIAASADRQLHYMNEFVSFIRDTPTQRYQNLLQNRPHIVQRVPQHYIASYLGVSKVHLSRIKSALSRKQ